MKNTLIVIGIIIAGWWFLSLFNQPSYDSYSPSSYSYENESGTTMDRYDAISDYWDEIVEYLDGTYTVVACSDNSGNCYDVDVDINSGSIYMLYFSNGGYIDIYGADVDSDGNASGDSDEDYWTFEVDGSDIDNAVDEWADYNGFVLE